MLLSQKGQTVFRFSAAVVSIFTATALLEILHSCINPTTVALAFILIILLTATFLGRNPALLSSLAAMLCFNYFFVSPLRTFTISDSQNLVACVAFMLTAIVAGELSA